MEINNLSYYLLIRFVKKKVFAHVQDFLECFCIFVSAGTTTFYKAFHYPFLSVQSCP